MIIINFKLVFFCRAHALDPLGGLIQWMRVEIVMLRQLWHYYQTLTIPS